ncbi:MAG: RdgB/HAM1 family non-canonical purine NTP pyrophosphatase [Promethearchaeota archaeon]
MDDAKDILYFITGNSFKFNEIERMFQTQEINYKLEQKTIDTTEIQATSIKEVALFKLNSVKGKLNNSYFIEDAGFFIDIPLSGFPGVYSKFVLNTIGNKGILKLIDNFEDTKAHFEAVIALYFQPLNKTLMFEGVIKGRVSETIRGTNGFGFDPIFIPDEIPTKTFAELTTEDKNGVSHRGKAWIKLFRFLKENP